MTLQEWILTAVPGIELGSPLATVGAQLGAKPEVRNTGLIDFVLKKLDGVARSVTVAVDGDQRVTSVDVIVAIKDAKGNPAKAALAALKKAVAAALTARLGAPNKEMQKNVPHWPLGEKQFVQMITWMSSDDMGHETHSLKLSRVRTS